LAKKRIAYVSAELNREDPDPDFDWPIFKQVCEDLPLDLRLVNWDDASVDWSEFDLAVVRSPWNYSNQREKFVSWAYRTEQLTNLQNPAKIIEANTDKRYLLELAKVVPIIPTFFIKEGQDATLKINELFTQNQALAVKPSVGAGASLASRVTNPLAAKAAIDRILQAGFVAMVQPYFEEVDTAGEVAVVLVGGEISHAVRKVPALTVGGHGDPQEIVEVTEQMRDFVQKISSQVGNFNELLYARVDVVPTKSGLVLMELEMTEPTLFFEQRPQAAKLLANKVLGLLSG